jgi:glyoxylase-like metal-dependent hydrolase (beta-lactamase superfamily II)
MTDRARGSIQELWLRGLLVLGSLLLGLGGAPSADAADKQLERAAKQLGVAKMQSLELEAAGIYFQIGQAPGPTLPWPAFSVANYKMQVDFARVASHVSYVRRQVSDPARARPAPVDQALDQYVAEGRTWNLAPAAAAGAAPVVTPMPANIEERTAEIWSTPQGFIKAALANEATVRRLPDTKQFEVKFNFLNKYRYEGLLNADGDVESVRTWIDNPVLGDMLMEASYSNYRDFGGVRFPAIVKRAIGNWPWYELTVTAVRVNTAQPQAVPAAVATAAGAPAGVVVDATKLAPGVWYLRGGTHHSVAVEQEKGVIVIEAPLNEERSLAVIAKLQELLPGKPISHVVNTHVHFDHAGGLRTYADAGAMVVTHTDNVPYLKRAWSAPRTLNPDRLALSKRQPRFTAVDVWASLGEKGHLVNVYPIQGSGHNDAYLMIYLPAQKILIQGDAWSPLADNKPTNPVNPLAVNLLENIERLGLDVRQIAALHGPRVTTVEDLREYVGLPRKKP